MLGSLLVPFLQISPWDLLSLHYMRKSHLTAWHIPCSSFLGTAAIHTALGSCWSRVLGSCWSLAGLQDCAPGHTWLFNQTRKIILGNFSLKNTDLQLFCKLTGTLSGVRVCAFLRVSCCCYGPDTQADKVSKNLFLCLACSRTISLLWRKLVCSTLPGYFPSPASINPASLEEWPLDERFEGAILWAMPEDKTSILLP